MPFLRAALAYWGEYPEEADAFLDRARAGAARARAQLEATAGTAGPVSAAAGDKPGALLLDEMFSPAIAGELTSRGIDCRAVVADALLRAQSDLEIFEAALLEGRIIVTNNVPDFESLRRAREAAGGAVPGLVYTSDVAFPRTKAYASRLVMALETAATAHETARHGGILWLPRHGRPGPPSGPDDRGRPGQTSRTRLACAARWPARGTGRGRPGRGTGTPPASAGAWRSPRTGRPPSPSMPVSPVPGPGSPTRRRRG
jgi:Domain of unknown function (DUF5615)